MAAPQELAGAVLLPADLRRQALEKMAAQRDPATMLDLFAQVLGMANGEPSRHVRRLRLSTRHPGEHLAGHHLRCHLLPAGTQPVLLPRRPGRPGQPSPHLRRPRQSHEARRHEMNRPTICRTTGQRIGLCKCFRCRPPAPEQPETPQCPLPNTN